MKSDEPVNYISVAYVFLIIINIILGFKFYKNIQDLINKTYNYDGIRYIYSVIPFLIVLLFVSTKLKSNKLVFLLSIISHFISINLNIELIPYIGLLTSIISIFFAIPFLIKKSDNKKIL